MKSIVNSLLALGAGTLTILFLELLLHVAKPAMNYAYMPQDILISHFQPSNFLPLELRPNSRSRFKMLEFDTIVETNSLGLRDKDIDYGKPRVLCLGDSFTFGFGVESDESFCAILEHSFGGRYDFVNAGFADGLSPDSYALWLKTYVSRVQPHIILVTLFQNDAGETYFNRWMRNGHVMTETEGGWPERIEKPGIVVTQHGNLMRNSILAKLPPVVIRILKNSYLIGLMRDRLFRDADVEIIDTKTHVATQELVRLQRSLELLFEAAQGRTMIFHLIAYLGQAELTPMDKVVLEFGRTHGIPIIYSYEQFTKRDFFALDPHWNRSGHAKAAAYLYPALTKLGL